MFPPVPRGSASSLAVPLVRYARPLALLAAVALLIATLISTAAAAASASLKPVADTWVNSVSPSANHGTSTTLRLDGSPVWRAYLKFDLTIVSGTIRRAELRLYANSFSKAGLAVHGVANTSWAEMTTTAANAPAIGSVAISSGALISGAIAGIDVTSLVSGHGLVSLALTANDQTAISLSSRESGHSPLLVVTTATPTPASSVTPARTATPAQTATPTPTLAAGSTPNPTSSAMATPAAAATPAQTATPTPTPAPTLTRSPTPKPTPSPGAPVRAAFYYPWFPEAWNQSGMNPFTHYHPSQGSYDGASAAVVAGQIGAMKYGKISVGIASWWGQGSGTDAKIPLLLSTAAGTGFKWAFYYEPEGTSDPTVAQIQSDLAYINSHYGSDPSAYRVGGKPVIFVYAQPADGCGMATRWAQANAAGADYVILKVFPGYAGCASQPNDWHQYAPAVAEDHQVGHSFSISPGFWLATDASPRLSRSVGRWQQEVADMVASGESWQLVTTFNEWGEGTSVESATDWSSSSGYGAYLDALHNT